MATKDQEKKNRDKELKDKTIEVNPDKTTKKAFGSAVKSNINQADQKKKIDDLLKNVKELQDKNLRLLAENENIRKFIQGKFRIVRVMQLRNLLWHY